MATTNDPLQSGNPNHPADPTNALAPKPPGQPSHDDHDTSGPPSDATVKRGYEEDTYDTKTVLSVPLLVILFFVLAFGTVTVLFSLIAYPAADPKAHPQAAERNKRSLNDRIRAVGEDREHPVRLDQIDVLTDNGKVDGRMITRPKSAQDNSPQVHPENVGLKPGDRPVADAVLGLDADKAAKTLAALFPSGGRPPLDPAASQRVPSWANAGRGAFASTARPPQAPKDEKKDDKKEPVKEPGKEPVKEPKKEPGKEPGKENKQ
ncbi:MAG: hypothetical protein K2V38_07395 [Gemmataceae bacterium]|nr:hypothetical protein [Gemmataceae bacterium]